MRLGAFGVGRMGQVHLEHLIALHRTGEIELAAIGDRFAPTLSSASCLLEKLGGPELTGIAHFQEPQTMAAMAQLDGVVIASRTEDHARDSLAFIRRNIAVLVEKPFANSIGEAADFCASLGHRANRVVLRGAPLGFADQQRRIRQRLQGNRHGGAHRRR